MADQTQDFSPLISNTECRTVSHLIHCIFPIFPKIQQNLIVPNWKGVSNYKQILLKSFYIWTIQIPHLYSCICSALRTCFPYFIRLQIHLPLTHIFFSHSHFFILILFMPKSKQTSSHILSPPRPLLLKTETL